jgi:hypothetical protein
MLNAQSPWIRTEKTLFSQLSINMIPEYNELYLSSGETALTDRNVTDVSIQAWFEYGLFENGMILAAIPLKMIKNADAADEQSMPLTADGTTTALGNVSLAWRHKLYEQSIIISGQLLVELPSSSYDDPSGIRSGYDAWGFIPTLSIGKGSERYYGFSWIGAGARTNNYSNIYKLGIEAGYRVSESIWLSGVIDVLQSLQNGSRKDPFNNLRTGLYVNNQEYVAWGIKAFGNILSEKWGVSAALYGAFSGNYVAKSPSLNLGVSYLLD